MAAVIVGVQFMAYRITPLKGSKAQYHVPYCLLGIQYQPGLWR
jgi:hypothetical protein